MTPIVCFVQNPSICQILTSSLVSAVYRSVSFVTTSCCPPILDVQAVAGHMIQKLLFFNLLTGKSRSSKPSFQLIVPLNIILPFRVKKAKEKKAKKAKTIKQLTAIGRRHLLGVRIVMKNMVYVVGMKLPAIGDEVSRRSMNPCLAAHRRWSQALSVLRSNDYFGQYGKISKLYLADLKSSTSVPSLGSDNSESTGIYIVYIRREDAARCISSLDGIPAPQGPPGAVLKASYGTARYCETFLKGGKCDYSNCHGLHEWGGESDTFTKEDMEIAYVPCIIEVTIAELHVA